MHITGQQPPVCSNYLPLEMDLISHKMKAAGFATHFIGKGHLSYLTTDHMPINRAFDSHVGYLNAMEEYQHGLDTGCFWKQCPWEHTCNLDFWDDHGPASAALLAGLHYSTNWYANRAISKIQQHPKDQGLYIHLTWYAQQHLPGVFAASKEAAVQRQAGNARPLHLPAPPAVGEHPAGTGVQRRPAHRPKHAARDLFQPREGA